MQIFFAKQCGVNNICTTFSDGYSFNFALVQQRVTLVESMLSLERFWLNVRMRADSISKRPDVYSTARLQYCTSIKARNAQTFCLSVYTQNFYTNLNLWYIRRASLFGSFCAACCSSTMYGPLIDMAENRFARAPHNASTILMLDRRLHVQGKVDVTSVTDKRYPSNARQLVTKETNATQ